MQINKSKAKNQCSVTDKDCAPPFQCELEAGHEGKHQWSAKSGKADVIKKFDSPVEKKA